MTFKIQRHYGKPRDFVAFPIDRDDHLGCGSYADVYQSSKYPNRVVKIAQGNDEGFYIFLEALSNEKNTNQHFPKIYRAAIVEHYDDPEYKFYKYHVEMEKLESLDPIGGNWWFGEPSETEYIVDALDWDTNEWRRQWLLHGTKLAEARDWLVKLYRKKRKKFPELSCDIHDENIMVRKDGTIVITDPFAMLGGGTWD